MAARKYIYFCETDRFGYTLQVIGRTEEEAKQAMINEYLKTYRRLNGTDPSEDYWNYAYDEESYLDVFLEELNVEKREFGKVEWT